MLSMDTAEEFDLLLDRSMGLFHNFSFVNGAVAQLVRAPV